MIAGAIQVIHFSSRGGFPIPHGHPSFWIDFAGRIGPPLFAASLVGCLLAGKFTVLHAGLVGLGIVLIAVHHIAVYHRRTGADERNEP